MKWKGLAVAVLVACISAPAEAAWKPWTSTDPMSGEVRKGAASLWTSPRRAMGFPYGGTKGVAGVACEGGGAYFRFTDEPNITGDDLESGYSVSRLRVRFDDNAPQRVRFTQGWGSDQLTTRSSAVRNGLLAKHKMLLEVPWHGEGNVIFEFDLTGSRKAYERACADQLREARRRKERAEREAREQREAAAKRQAEARAAEAAEREVRARQAEALAGDLEQVQAVIGATDWKCRSVDSVRIAADARYLIVECQEGEQYSIALPSLAVDDIAGRGRKTAEALKRQWSSDDLGAMVRGAGGLCRAATAARAVYDGNGRAAVRVRCTTRTGRQYSYQVYENGEVKVKPAKQ